MTINLIEQIIKTIRNYQMINHGDVVLAAVSGGPDSVFLLHALCQLEHKLKIKGIAVGNLDHGLRGKDSEEDSAFVRKLSGDLNLQFFHKKINMKDRRLKSLSTEESARMERYNFLKDTARRVDADVIATGHTLDDQAETILMRVIKGSSLKGIVGISPVREEGGIRIIRPLINVEKDEIVRYLDKAGIAYRIDHTNLEDKYFRNVVRKDVVPFLKKYNPRLKRALFNLAEHLREDYDFIERERRKAGDKILARGGGGAGVEIGLKEIVIQPRTLQKEILRDALERSGGEVKRLSFRHWKEVEGLIKYKRKGSSIDLPGDIRVTRTDRALVFHKRRTFPTSTPVV